MLAGSAPGSPRVLPSPLLRSADAMKKRLVESLARLKDGMDRRMELMDDARERWKR
jgi:hypothetical protein